jgi:hypothetical protein
MFHMDQITSTLVESEYQKLSPRCPYLTRLEIETCALAQLEADGKIMRYLVRNGKTVAWKAAPRLCNQAAKYEADRVGEDINHLNSRLRGR